MPLLMTARLGQYRQRRSTAIAAAEPDIYRSAVAGAYAPRPDCFLWLLSVGDWWA